MFVCTQYDCTYYNAQQAAIYSNSLVDLNSRLDHLNSFSSEQMIFSRYFGLLKYVTTVSIQHAGNS